MTWHTSLGEVYLHIFGGCIFASACYDGRSWVVWIVGFYMFLSLEWILYCYTPYFEKTFLLPNGYPNTKPMKMEDGAEFACFYCLTKKEPASLSRQRSKQWAPTRVCWAWQTNIPDFTRSYSSYDCCWIWCCTFFKATKYHQLATQCYKIPVFLSKWSCDL